MYSTNTMTDNQSKGSDPPKKIHFLGDSQIFKSKSTLEDPYRGLKRQKKESKKEDVSFQFESGEEEEYDLYTDEEDNSLFDKDESPITDFNIQNR